MRLIRTAALLGSLVLIVGAVVTIYFRRADQIKDYELQLNAASVLATNGVSTTIDHAVVIATVAPADADPESLDVFPGLVDICVVDADGRATCNREDVTDTDAYHTAGHELTDRGDRARDAVVVVDGDEACVLVVGRSESHTVAIRLPSAALLDEGTAAAVERYSGDVDITVSPTLDAGSATDGVVTVDGEQVRITTSEDPPQVGVIDAAWTVIAERRRLERRATTDELTGLLNRREFERQCEEAILNADRFRTGLCIMLLDLDDFKAINDTRGHHVGDQVLIETADRLRDAVRDTDVVGRWGGDEFVILLPGLEQTTAVRNSAERIGASLSGTPVAGDLSVSGSIGAALYPRHGRTFDELIRAADGAMYGAKTTGVTHRLADALSGDDPGGSGEHYDGPDRRRTPSTGEPVA
jgi:diguanylate cyclase (GGDEF)-like protein